MSTRGHHGLLLQAIGGGGGSDPYWADVSALLHMDGVDASTTFTDETAKVWTASGNAQIDTSQYKFGGASGLFDGSGDYITTPSDADFAYGTGDFTWEAWVRLYTTSGNQYIIDHGSNGGVIAYRAGTLVYYNPTTGISSPLYATSIPLSSGVWYHIAASRVSGTTRLFVDGALKASGADSHNYSSLAVNLGRYGGGSNYLYGWLDDVRITKGVGRYTSAFIPPSAPFPNS